MSFSGASGFVINNPIFLIKTEEDSGLQVLNNYSLPDAAYDSRAQEIFATSLPKSRYENFVDTLVTRWSVQSNPVRAVWLSGPKSNLAHICAKKLEDHLAATFFFSKKIRVEDPARLFTTISYQLAILFPAYRAILRERLRQDPTLLSKRLEVQFRELISRPFQQLLAIGETVGVRRFILVEGLDECTGFLDRCEILRIVATSTKELPFRWLFLSQPIPAAERRLLNSVRGSNPIKVVASSQIIDINYEEWGEINHDTFSIAILHLERPDGQRLYFVIGLIALFDPL